MDQQDRPARSRPRRGTSSLVPDEPDASLANAPDADRAARIRAEARPAGTQSIETAIRVLLALADVDQPAAVSDLARRLGLHKSMVSRQLAMLKTADFVTQDGVTSRYALGLGLLPLAAKVLAAHRLSGTARLRLEALARSTRETVTVSGWNGSDAINLDQFARPGAKRPLAPPGRLNPAHCTSTGKAFLARLDANALAQHLGQPLVAYTARTVTDACQLGAEIDQVRRTHLAFNRGEFIAGIDAVATLVRPKAGMRPFAIAITMPSRRASQGRLEDLGQELLTAARDIAAT